MKCRCKVLSVAGVPASDGSIVPLQVMQDYLASQKCKEALEKHKMLGSLTHRCRNLASVFPENPALSKTVGKDDSLLIVSEKAPTPTHYISDLSIKDGWLWAEITLLEEDGLDDIAIQNIRRFKGMLKNGIRCGISGCLVGFWSNNNNSGDVLEKLVSLKSIDVTLNPSWVDAGIEEIIEDENSTEKIESKTFSNTEEDYSFDGIKVKTFSNVNEFGITEPKSSKINGQFTKLMVKEFSVCGAVTEIPEEDLVVEQKDFTQAEIKERLREFKLGPRVYMRRLYISYKQAIRSLGNNPKEQDIKILKSMFASDVLRVLNSITPEVVEKGKQINTLLGLSALSKTAREEGQKLQIPLRMAMKEMQKAGFVSKMRFSKLQEAYLGFIKGLTNDVFGSIEGQVSEEVEQEVEEGNK